MATIPPATNKSTFYNGYNANLYVPANSLDLYQSTEPWNNFYSIQPIADSLPGDVDGDGQINIQDVTKLIGLILADEASSNSAADVNGDGNINIADVAALVHKILGQE